MTLVISNEDYPLAESRLAVGLGPQNLIKYCNVRDHVLTLQRRRLLPDPLLFYCRNKSS